jgi:hypothetical protein
MFLSLIGKYYLPPTVITFYSFFEILLFIALTGDFGSIFEGS